VVTRPGSARCRRRRRRGPPQPDRSVDIARFQRAALLQPGIKRLEHLAGAFAHLGLAMHGKLVAAAQNLHAQPRLQQGQVPVEFAAKIDEQPVVGKLQKRFGGVFRSGRGGQRADAQ
jgi:hypothetical protein